MELGTDSGSKLDSNFISVGLLRNPSYRHDVTKPTTNWTTNHLVDSKGKED